MKNKNIVFVLLFVLFLLLGLSCFIGLYAYIIPLKEIKLKQLIIIILIDLSSFAAFWLSDYFNKKIKA